MAHFTSLLLGTRTLFSKRPIRAFWLASIGTLHAISHTGSHCPQKITLGLAERGYGKGIHSLREILEEEKPL